MKLKIKMELSNEGAKYDYKNLDHYKGPPKQLHDFVAEKTAEIAEHIREVNAATQEAR